MILFHAATVGGLLLSVGLVLVLVVFGWWLRDTYGSTALLWLASGLVVNFLAGLVAAPLLANYLWNAGFESGGQMAANVAVTRSFVAKSCPKSLRHSVWWARCQGGRTSNG